MSHKKIQKQCEICGKIFSPVNHPEQRTCSKKCSGFLSWRTRMGKGEKPGRNHFQGICKNCGQHYMTNGYNPTEYCSIKCAKIAWSKNHIPARPKWTKFPEELEWTPGAVTDAGYVAVYLPEHPHATKKGRILEHRLVMEKEMGRFLESWEKVHHRNAIKTDNRVENLEIVTQQGRTGGWFAPTVGTNSKCTKTYMPPLWE